MNKVVLFIFLSLLSIYSFAGEVRLQDGGLVIVAKYESNSVQKSKNSNFLYGEIQITNNSLTPMSYGNSNLLLSIDDIKSKTYLDTIASATIDFSSITLQSFETKKLNVYWAFRLSVSTKDKTAALLWSE
ncbi:MAG: hypothetical protein HYZ31_04120 [Gammaproteobacteria bacterium]|nr:hypothetical protein [Gammaproteobacteria bacterium]